MSNCSQKDEEFQFVLKLSESKDTRCSHHQKSATGVTFAVVAEPFPSDVLQSTPNSMKRGSAEISTLCELE